MKCLHCEDDLPDVSETCPLCPQCLADSALIVIQQCEKIIKLENEISNLHREIENLESEIFELNSSEYQ